MIVGAPSNSIPTNAPNIDGMVIIDASRGPVLFCFIRLKTIEEITHIEELYIPEDINVNKSGSSHFDNAIA